MSIAFLLIFGSIGIFLRRIPLLSAFLDYPRAAGSRGGSGECL
jgi:hypothetical protein